MSSTYLELCSKMRQEVGVTGSGPSSVENQVGMLLKLVTWVADADIEIQSRWNDWQFLWTEFSEDLTVGVNNISHPSDLGQWLPDSFWIDYSSVNNSPLDVVSYREWRSTYGPGLQATGKPSVVTERPDRDLLVHPVPDGSYVLTAEYYKAPSRMTANDSVSPIPGQYERIIIARAKMYYAEHENAPEILNVSTSEYSDLLSKLESRFLLGQIDRANGEAVGGGVVVE